MEFLAQMEDLLNRMQLPQSFTIKRAFRTQEPVGASPPGERQQRGAAATFRLKILFRQNSSWQGSVTWVETGREEPFRSVLELLLLMSSALPR
jgi:hypothetical protein